MAHTTTAIKKAVKQADHHQKAENNSVDAALEESKAPVGVAIQNGVEIGDSSDLDEKPKPVKPQNLNSDQMHQDSNVSIDANKNKPLIST